VNRAINRPPASLSDVQQAGEFHSYATNCAMMRLQRACGGLQRSQSLSRTNFLPSTPALSAGMLCCVGLF